MKNCFVAKIIIIIFLMLGSGNLYLMAQSQAKNKKSLQLKIKTSKEIYNQNEEIKVKFIIKNIYSKVITINKSKYAFSLNVLPPEGSKLEQLEFFYRTPRPSKNDFVQIMPGKIWTTDFILINPIQSIKRNFPHVERAYEIKSAGVYKIKGNYHNFWDINSNSLGEEKSKDVFKGDISSEIIFIKVEGD
ncbi:MAG: hypothetical protein K9L61_03380 [Candidatus Omnitrophica bacterium]|nr:hypothetical protein [Candidatus Omnitrophota bacterium]